jgi:hypothetical protein
MEDMRSKTEAFDIRKLDTLPPQEGAAVRLPLVTRRGEKNDKMNSRTQTFEKRGSIPKIRRFLRLQ